MRPTRKKKPGPKPRPKYTVRWRVIQVICTESEYLTIRRRAGLVPLSAYLRERGLR